MDSILNFLGRTRGQQRLAGVDLLTYLYLTFGTLIMFGPVVWLIISSFKPQAQLIEFPPTLLPYRQETVVVPSRNVEPDGGTHTTVVPVQLSETVGSG